MEVGREVQREVRMRYVRGTLTVMGTTDDELRQGVMF